MKTKNPTITTLLSIGGGNADYSTYSSSEQFFIYEILYLHFSFLNANATDRPTILIFDMDPIRRFILDWKKRIHIIQGITQGLLYLQEYSRLIVIHLLKGLLIVIFNRLLNFTDICNYSVQQWLYPS